MLLLEHLEVLLGDADLVDAVIAHRLAHRRQRVEIRKVVPELVGTRLREPLPALAGDRRTVIADRAGLERVEDLVERILADALLALGRDLETLGGALDLAGAFEEFLEVGHAELLVEEAVLLAELLHPAQRFLDVAAGLQQEVAIDVHQLLDELEVFGTRAPPLRIVELHGRQSSPMPLSMLLSMSL